MNEFLAQLYNTRETIGAQSDSSDVEKLAEAHILDGLLHSEGIDVDQLDDGTILKLAYEIFGDNSELVKSAAEVEAEEKKEEPGESAAEEKKEEEKEESSEEKTAEADLLGRIMAHSMVNELGQIELEKQAKKNTPPVKKASAKPGSLAERLETLKKEAAAKKAPVKKKTASALDTLAEQRAREILSENGVNLEGDTAETKLASAIEKRAWELLAEAGYVQEK